MRGLCSTLSPRCERGVEMVQSYGGSSSEGESCRCRECVQTHAPLGAGLAGTYAIIRAIRYVQDDPDEDRALHRVHTGAMSRGQLRGCRRPTGR